MNTLELAKAIVALNECSHKDRSFINGMIAQAAHYDGQFTPKMEAVVIKAAEKYGVDGHGRQESKRQKLGTGREDEIDGKSPQNKYEPEAPPLPAPPPGERNASQGAPSVHHPKISDIDHHVPPPAPPLYPPNEIHVPQIPDPRIGLTEIAYQILLRLDRIEKHLTRLYQIQDRLSQIQSEEP